MITRAEGRWEGEGRGGGQSSQGTQRGAKYPSGYNLETGQTQRTPTLTISERQQAYFDSTPTGDLSSCRGDPMTIVKNLQNLQNCNSVPPDVKVDEQRPTPKTSQKNRRKSGDKGLAVQPVETVAPPEVMGSGRVPPPAHHNNPSGQQVSLTLWDEI